MRFGNDGEGVEIALDDGVADVRLDRPDKLNALSQTMFAAVSEAIDWLSRADDVRCVVLSGNGRSFCVGIDLAVLQTGVGPLVPRTKGIANDFQHCTWGWRELPIPVIAAVHGHCYGAGIQMALGADIRIAPPDSEISIMEMQHGIIPDLGAFALARGVIREDVMRELVYTAKTVSGEEAQPLGLVTRLADDPLAEAKVLARDIAAKSPAAIRAAKRMFAKMPEDGAATLLQAESEEEDGLIAAIMEKMRG